MAYISVADGGPEQVFKLGPEDLVATSPVIVAGPVSGYSRQVQKHSQPGPDGFPLEWVATGQIQELHALKGEAPLGPLSFSRAERSVFLPLDPATPVWEREYGEFSPQGQAVLFLGAGDPHPIIKVLPSGSGEQDLVGLVRDIVRIQLIQDPAQQRHGWLSYLTSVRSDEGRRAALRSLVGGGVGWSQMAPALKTLFEEPGVSQNSRGFAFGFVAFHVVGGTWGEQAEAAVDLLCQVFSGERDADVALEYLQSFKLMLDYTIEEPLQMSREPLRKHILQCLEKWASTGLRNAELEEEYEEIRANYGAP